MAVSASLAVSAADAPDPARPARLDGGGFAWVSEAAGEFALAIHGACGRLIRSNWLSRLGHSRIA